MLKKVINKVKAMRIKSLKKKHKSESCSRRYAKSEFARHLNKKYSIEGQIKCSCHAIDFNCIKLYQIKSSEWAIVKRSRLLELYIQTLLKKEFFFCFFRV